MLMEFKYGAVADETFNNSQDVPTKAFYWLKKYAFPLAYWKFAPTGKWFGKNAIIKPSYLKF